MKPQAIRDFSLCNSGNASVINGRPACYVMLCYVMLRYVISISSPNCRIYHPSFTMRIISKRDISLAMLLTSGL
jgi:hypothetical protein